MSQTDLLEQLPSFQLKGGMLPLTTLELLNASSRMLASQLGEKIAQAPEFFQDAPIILALDKLPGRISQQEFTAIVDCLQQLDLHLVGVRASNEQDIAAAKAHRLPVLPPLGNKAAATTGNDETDKTAASRPATGPLPARIVQQPVRSGQQIYAQNTDLIVLAAVSSGAEVLADGNIHIYGPLRGKAAAGINGNQQARIFCQQLEADMISIAGNYKIAEQLRQLPTWGAASHICLHEQQLHIQKM